MPPPNLGRTPIEAIESPIPLEMPESLQVTQPAWIGCGRRRLPAASGDKEASGDSTAVGDSRRHTQPATASDEDVEMSIAGQQGTGGLGV